MSVVQHSNPQYKPPRPTAWLWKLAIATVVVAGGLIAIIAQDLPDQSASTSIRRVIAIASVVVGLCAIAATAGRWTSR